MSSSFGVFLGLDVGKDAHHAVGLDPDGKRLHDGPLPNSEPKLQALFDKLAQIGTLLVVVDQPATIGALPVAVARAAGHQVAYLPGLAMRRIADLYPGRAKTDARDAFIIADAARSLPHTLRPVDVGDDALAELEVLIGFDDDLAGEATRLSNRIRGLLTGIHPALERAIRPRVSHPAVLEILSRFGGPSGIGKAGRRRLVQVDIGLMVAAAVIENVGYRQFVALWQVVGLIDAVRRRKPGWGTMTRTGFGRPDPDAPGPHRARSVETGRTPAAPPAGSPRRPAPNTMGSPGATTPTSSQP
jgi:transposase